MVAPYIATMTGEGSTIIRDKVPPYNTPEFREVFRDRERYREFQLGRELTNSERVALLDSLRQLAGEPSLFPEETYLDLQKTAENLKPYRQFVESFLNAGENIGKSAKAVGGDISLSKGLSTINLISAAVIVGGVVYLWRK